jgi:hypothetical protein
MIWTELTASVSELSSIYIEMDTAATLVIGQAGSVAKNGYLIGFRANGTMNMYDISGATPTGPQIATNTGLPNPPVVNTVYPCRIVVDATNVTVTFDVGGLDVVMTAANTSHRGGKYMQLERRGHGFMIANLRRS